jgi:hypothetical protein
MESEQSIEVVTGTAELGPRTVHAVAVSREEMVEANGQIREFLSVKLDGLRLEHQEMQDAIDVAMANNWKIDVLGKAEKKLRRQVMYYDKLVAALDAGFTIVPNMPCDQFAIRVKRALPRETAIRTATGYEPNAMLKDETGEILPAGEGRYESPNQLIREERSSFEAKPGTMEHTHFIRATEWDAIEFPFAAAVPIVMSATQAAMALKLFDRIGLVPQQVRMVEDPIVLGQIVLRENGRERVASFLIAWHLDMRTL